MIHPTKPARITDQAIALFGPEHLQLALSH
jgi:hypothetical protein